MIRITSTINIEQTNEEFLLRIRSNIVWGRSRLKKVSHGEDVSHTNCPVLYCRLWKYQFKVRSRVYNLNIYWSDSVSGGPGTICIWSEIIFNFYTRSRLWYGYRQPNKMCSELHQFSIGWFSWGTGTEQFPSFLAASTWTWDSWYDNHCWWEVIISIWSLRHLTTYLSQCQDRTRSTSSLITWDGTFSHWPFAV